MADVRDDKQVAAALKRLESIQLLQAFDPYRPDSRPNKMQASILADIGKIQYLSLIHI